jgi:hypothetical protein
MLDVNNVLPTPYQKVIERWRLLMFRRRRRRRKRRRKTKTKTKDENERRKRRSKKNSRKKKVNFQNKCVSSQNKQMRKEEGATATASHLPSLSWLSSGRTGSVLQRTPILWERVINYRKCPTYDAGDFQTSDWLSKTDELQRCRWVWENRLKHKNVMTQTTIS